MALYRVSVEKSIRTEVEIEAGSRRVAEEMAEEAAESGEYDDDWMNLDANARYLATSISDAYGESDET